MGTSTWEHVSFALELIADVRPRSVLDVGVGFGRWGFLVRELTDVWSGRDLRAQWTTRIEGIEAHAPYLQAHQRFLYDALHVGDAVDVIGTLGRFDLVILGDVIEHQPQERGRALLEKARAHGERVLACVPLGDAWTQTERNDNAWEAHRSSWTRDALMAIAGAPKAWRQFDDFLARPYGVFLW